MASHLLACEVSMDHFFGRYQEKYGFDLSEMNDQVDDSSPKADERSSFLAFPSRIVNKIDIEIHNSPFDGLLFGYLLGRDASSSPFDSVGGMDQDSVETIVKVAVGVCAVAVLITGFFVGGFLFRGTVEAMKVCKETKKIEKEIDRKLVDFPKQIEQLQVYIDRDMNLLSSFNTAPTDLSPEGAELSSQFDVINNRLDQNTASQNDASDAIRDLERFREIVHTDYSIHKGVLQKKSIHLIGVASLVSGVTLLAVGIIIPYTYLIVAGSVVTVAMACLGAGFFAFHVGDSDRVKEKVKETVPVAKKQYQEWGLAKSVDKETPKLS